MFDVSIELASYFHSFIDWNALLIEQRATYILDSQCQCIAFLSQALQLTKEIVLKSKMWF